MSFCYPQPCLSGPSTLPLPTKLLSPPHSTHLFLLHSTHWMMGNRSLSEHPNTTSTMMMENSILKTDCISPKLPDKVWYHPSMPVRPVDMAVYFTPSTYSNGTFVGQEWPPIFGNTLLNALFAKQTKSTPIPLSQPSCPWNPTVPALSNRSLWTLLLTYPPADLMTQSWL